MSSPRRSKLIPEIALLLACVPALCGCNILAIFGYAAESYKRSATHAVAAEYDGLAGKSFAVIVSGDRALLGSYPTLFTRLTSRITQRLVENRDAVGATGFVPPLSIAEFQITNPNWSAWGFDRLAEELGVERLIVVELQEYRLTEPGNQYLWDAVAWARVGVVEADGPTPSEFAFKQDIRVRFPDDKAMGPDDFPSAQVQGNLEKRFVDRVTWLFHEHQEPYYPEY